MYVLQVQSFHFSSFTKEHTWKMRSLRHSSQRDSSSCRVFCALFGEYLLGRRLSMSFETFNMEFQRQSIWRSMVEAAVETDSLCRTCGEAECSKNSRGHVDKWVRYDIIKKRLAPSIVRFPVRTPDFSGYSS